MKPSLTQINKNCMITAEYFFGVFMRINRILLFILFLLLLACGGANPHIRSVTQGNVQAYLQQTPQAEEHANAGANILYSYYYVEFFSDGTSVTRHVERVKIFNERGRSFASQTIYYREGYQRPKILFANTIKPDGQVVSLNLEDVHDSSAYAGYDFYTDIRKKRFNMPAVEDGCIIEYAYEIRNLKPIINFDFFSTFFCRQFHPMEVDIMEIVLPRQIELKYRKFNADLTPEIVERGNKNAYIFTNTSQDEIIPEARMPSLRDTNTFPQISMWTLDNWETISGWYAKLISEQMKTDHELIEFTNKLISDKKSREEKISAIFDFVAQRIRYVAVLLGPYTHKPHPAYEVFQKRYGDCKDKTTLLLTMLQIAGIEALPALVPSYPEYFDKTMPSLTAFNHVIAVVPDKKNEGYFWLDATNETASFDSVPFFRPAEVFLINADGTYDFVRTPSIDSNNDFIQTDIKYKIEKEGHAEIEAAYLYSGKAAESIRRFYKYSPPEERKKFFERRGITVYKLNFGSFTDTRKPFIINMSGYLKNLAHKLDDDLMVLSDIVNFDSYQDITAATERKYPVFLNPSYFSRDNLTYIFPAGFKIRRLPANFFINESFLLREEYYFFKNNTLKISIKHKSNHEIIEPEKIDDFRKFARKIQAHQSAVKNIIFEKH